MIAIIIILLCAMIFVPLVDLVLTPEQSRFALILKAVAYLAVFVYVLVLIFRGGALN